MSLLRNLLPPWRVTVSPWWAKVLVAGGARRAPAARFYIQTAIGVRYGPYRTREAAEAYPRSGWGLVADGPAWRMGWHVEELWARGEKSEPGDGCGTYGRFDGDEGCSTHRALKRPHWCVCVEHVGPGGGWHRCEEGATWSAAESVAPMEPDRSPSEIFYAGGGVPNERLAEMLRLAGESHHRRVGAGSSDVLSALLTATPPRANSASLRFGVAWWGGIEGTGLCACCGETQPVHKGYNGGAHMSARFCTPCTASNHEGCTR